MCIYIYIHLCIAIIYRICAALQNNVNSGSNEPHSVRRPFWSPLQGDISDAAARASKWTPTIFALDQELPHGDFNHFMGIEWEYHRDIMEYPVSVPSVNHSHHLGITLCAKQHSNWARFTIPKSEIRPIFENDNSYPLVIQHDHGKSSSLMGKLTINAIFNS